MKIAIPSVLVLILITGVFSAAAAAPSGIHEPGTGIQGTNLNESGQGPQAGLNESGQGVNQSQQAGLNESGQGIGQTQQEQVEQETQNVGENATLQIQQRVEVRVQNSSELYEMIEQRELEMNQEIQSLEEHQQLVYLNQNKVRLTVQSLLAAEELMGGVGTQISQIAEEINTSVQATIRAEERIQSRNSFLRFFVGGDEEAAQEIEQQVIQNQERIQQLQQLVEGGDCDDGVRAMLQEQLQNVEQEQTRLQQLALNELNDKGLFGWLWK